MSLAKNRVVVGMSGGVDSSVAALLLKKRGYDVVGVFMKNWDEDDENGVCTASYDYDDVRRVCDHIDIPYYSVNFVKEYWDKVFSIFLDEYSKGRTPNPDILCNKEIKFEAFLNFALGIDADYIATGHYCRNSVNNGAVDNTLRNAALLKGIDPNKDQSYFLAGIGSRQLEKVIFPIGDLSKPEIREIAKKEGLPTADKKDSMGICFIGKRDFKGFLSQYLPAQSGEIVSLSGEVVGEHDGLMYYTLGQRKGMGIGGREGTGEPWFVIEKDLDSNRLIVDQGNGENLLSQALYCEKVNWIAGKAPSNKATSNDFECTAKVRHLQEDQACRVKVENGGYYVSFENYQRAVTAGQWVVFYSGEVCLGGGAVDKVYKNSVFV